MSPVPISVSSLSARPSIHLRRNSATYLLPTMPYSRSPVRFAADSWTTKKNNGVMVRCRFTCHSLLATHLHTAPLLLTSIIMHALSGLAARQTFSVLIGGRELRGVVFRFNPAAAKPRIDL